MHLLQNVVFPNLDVQAMEDMYVRLNRLAWADLNGRQLRFAEAGTASTDTFYGGLTVDIWKRDCNLGHLGLRLEGDGHFALAFGLHRHGLPHQWLSEREVHLQAGNPLDLTIEEWPTLTTGILYFRLRAYRSGSIASASYVTSDRPRNEVVLGMVITHFNRQAQVVPAIRRIEHALLARPDLEGRVTLTVVDNSNNLALGDAPRVRVIGNENYGGSGGFTRGLLDLIDSGDHTHALLMDDDASCEPDSIARTVALLQHAVEPKLAVAGSLLNELVPWQLFEKGACFDGVARPLHGGLDMRRVDHLLEAETNRTAPDYGGWWFFAFPLSEIRRFPFPFFVRGDDIFFGLSNRFKIATLNGVGCFGEDFSIKHGPMTAYLDARYHLLYAILHGGAEAGSLIRKLGRQLHARPLHAYHYASARAFTLAMEHVLEGPDFFRRNLDLRDVRAAIAQWTPAERLQPVDRSALRIRRARVGRESRLRRWARVLTWQGFLLPRWLLQDRTTLQTKSFHGSASAVFRYRRVLYEHPQMDLAYLAEHDRAAFFAEMRRFRTVRRQLLRRLPELESSYRSGFEAMTTATFWRELYNLPARTTAVTPSVASTAPTPGR